MTVRTHVATRARTGVLAIALATAVAVPTTTPATAADGDRGGDAGRAGTRGGVPALVEPGSVGRVVPVPTRTVATVTLRPGSTRAVRVAGRAGVPTARVRGVFLTVTASKAGAGGRVTIATPGQRSSGATAAAVRPGHVTSGTTLVRPGPDGRVLLRSTAPVRIRLDVNAYVAGRHGQRSGAGGVTAVPPVTRLDTARGLGGGALRADRIRTVPVTGRGGVPTAGVSAVVVTVTLSPQRGPVGLAGVDPQFPLDAWPMGRATRGAPLITTTTLPVDPDGRVGLLATGRSDARLDVVGWVRAGGDRSAAATMAGGLAPVSELVVAGRLNLPATVRPGRPRTLEVLGVGAVPEQVSGVVLAVATSTRRDRRAALSVSTPGRPDTTNPVPVRGTASRRLEFVTSDAQGRVVLRAVGAPVRARVSVVAYLPAGTATVAPAAPPTIEITSPSDGATLTLGEGGQFTVEGTATDGGAGLARIEVLGDGALLGVADLDTSSQPARWSAQTASPGGVGTITAVAVDRAGVRTSTGVAVTVVLPSVDETIVTTRTVVADERMREAAREVTDSRITLDGKGFDLNATDVLVSEPIPDVADEGLLVRVLAVDVVGDRTVLRTGPAQLDDVFVQADFADAVPVTDPAAATPAAIRPRAKSPALTLDVAIPLSLQKTFKKEVTKGRTTFTVDGTIGLQGRLTGQLRMSLSVGTKWDWWIPRPYVQYFEVGVKFGAEANVNLAVSGSVETEFPLATVPTGTFTFVIGFIPVVITSQASAAFYSGLSLAGSVSFGVSASKDLGVVYTSSAGWRTINESRSDVGQWNGAVTGTISAGVRVSEGIFLYGVAGPSLEFGAGPEVTGGIECTGNVTDITNPSCSGTWAFQAVFTGAVKASVQILGYSLGEQRWEFARFTVPICSYPVKTGYRLCPFVPRKVRSA